MKTVTWNYDKPHRCPECHRTWIYQFGYRDGVSPRWWKTYTCFECGARFTGRWAWFVSTYYSLKLRMTR